MPAIVPSDFSPGFGDYGDQCGLAALRLKIEPEHGRFAASARFPAVNS
jgi:hypothetical protein